VRGGMKKYKKEGRSLRERRQRGGDVYLFPGRLKRGEEKGGGAQRGKRERVGPAHTFWPVRTGTAGSPYTHSKKTKHRDAYAKQHTHNTVE
jgi:hypothetical protein